ncbi:hypothetical protein AMTRI_Chr01g112750 [Amborella trichopoda]|uniref:Protein farnesyltransferase subunit beta n=1 Tax=Amborella trichopoda TaxID=13333 RepID=W1PF95_AMBTC|nr:protein farnesyltransferase subunit beta [Amborella trichopoda]ERN06638.1 hypothetical protein AMTR_s00058p00175640 [Amborella trichopoda]|eukprot:XP_006844963.1 protein farnesyltransferase subunit beta [Amborella trichopoda]
MASDFTVTQRQQLLVQEKVGKILNTLIGASPGTKDLLLELWYERHIEFLNAGLKQLGPGYSVLDANRPWLCYWIIHSIALLGDSVDDELEDRAIDFLSRCQDTNGGYGGGPGQIPHLATTYAAVNTLITIGGEKALSSINRDKMHMFLLRMKDPSGAFRMHDAGEMDVRACYTAISVASILNILDYELVQNVGNYILSCQTYEGGIAGEPGSEAHGGYTFCGLAAMILINEADRMDLPSLVDWVAFRQGVEGGFQGRTNKLVDGCYSFWQGGVLVLIQRMSSIIDKQLKVSHIEDEKLSMKHTCESADNSSEEESSTEGYLYQDRTIPSFKDCGSSFIKESIDWGPLFNCAALQQYILLCCQVLEGGFKDKPGKARDHYHTCYCLSGLSVCQYSSSKDLGVTPPPNAVLGPCCNLLERVHPLYNVVLERYQDAHEYYYIS